MYRHIELRLITVGDLEEILQHFVYGDEFSAIIAPDAVADMHHIIAGKEVVDGGECPAGGKIGVDGFAAGSAMVHPPEDGGVGEHGKVQVAGDESTGKAAACHLHILR